jgi:hypothetical protein
MGGEGGRGGSDMAPPIERRAPTKLERITAMMKLGRDQAKTLKAILDEASREAAPLREQLVKTRMGVAATVQDGKSDAEKAQAVNALADVDAQMTALELRAFVKFYKGLESVEQKRAAGGLFTMLPGFFKNKNWNED